VWDERLLLHDSFNGAVVNAGAAANADVGVDDVLLVALGDSLDGAVVGAGAALDASVSDIVSHDFPSIYVLYALASQRIFILAWIFENAIPFLKILRLFFMRAGENLPR
jgi:hypothetical protein